MKATQALQNELFAEPLYNHEFNGKEHNNSEYISIAEKSGMKIVNTFKRPVLNRTERDKGAYAEIIFHMKEV